MKLPPEEESKKPAKKSVPVKKTEIIDGFTIKYHANGKTRWSKGKILDGKAQGYWEWYRPDGTLKRSGYFDNGAPVGAWTTYDNQGHVYKTTIKKGAGSLNHENEPSCPPEDSALTE